MFACGVPGEPRACGVDVHGESSRGRTARGCRCSRAQPPHHLLARARTKSAVRGRRRCGAGALEDPNARNQSVPWDSRDGCDSAPFEPAAQARAMRGHTPPSGWPRRDRHNGRLLGVLVREDERVTSGFAVCDGPHLLCHLRGDVRAELPLTRPGPALRDGHRNAGFWLLARSCRCRSTFYAGCSRCGNSWALPSSSRNRCRSPRR